MWQWLLFSKNCKCPLQGQIGVPVLHFYINLGEISVTPGCDTKNKISWKPARDLTATEAVFSIKTENPKFFYAQTQVHNTQILV